MTVFLLKVSRFGERGGRGGGGSRGLLNFEKNISPPAYHILRGLVRGRGGGEVPPA